MFKITFFVEDKHLAGVLHAIAGKALNLESKPVVNAEVKAGTVRQARTGSLISRVLEQLRTYDKGTELRAKDIQHIMMQAGATSTANYSTVVGRLKALKRINTKRRGHFTVLEQPKEH